MDKGYQLSERLQFHLLRHFTDPGEEYLQAFLERAGFSRKEAEEQLQLPGSKFHRSFAADPLKLWDIITGMISSGRSHAWHATNRKVFSFEFDRAEYPEGIGTTAVLPLEALAGHEKELIRMEDRDGYPVPTVSGIKARPTWEMHMVVVLADEPFISTIFPGIYAPPFPDAASQNEDEMRENERFWKSHVLITSPI